MRAQPIVNTSNGRTHFTGLRCNETSTTSRHTLWTPAHQSMARRAYQNLTMEPVDAYLLCGPQLQWAKSGTLLEAPHSIMQANVHV
jgi:hypothetical protein